MAKTKKSIYGVHPGVKMMADWIASFPPKTGNRWTSGTPSSSAMARMMRSLSRMVKEKHGFGTNAAWWLTDYAHGKALDGDPDEYMTQAAQYLVDMYAGGKSGLKPMHDAILELRRYSVLTSSVSV